MQPIFSFPNRITMVIGDGWDMEMASGFWRGTVLAGAVACLMLILSVWPVISCAQSETPSPPVQAHTSPEVKVLEAQVAIMREYQDQFVSMVNWSLGAVLTMAFGLAAFNWYSSKASYDRDIQALRQENKTLHIELSALLKSEANQIEKNLRETLATAQTDIQNTFTKLVDSKISSIKNEVLSLKFKSTKQEAKDALEKKSYEWAISKYCELLEVSVRQGSDHYEVGEILDAIGDVLDNPATSLSADSVTDAIESMQRLPTRYQAAAQNLIQRITRAQK